MNKKRIGIFSGTKQNRSKRTLDELLIAAFNIVEEANTEKFTGRSLAQKSGYALGTLVKRLTSIDNAFLWAFTKGRENHVRNFEKIMEGHDETAPLEVLVEKFVDAFFAAIQSVNPKVIRFFEDSLVKKNAFSSVFDHYTDALVVPYLATARRNKTETFRQMTDMEATLVLRSTLAIIERPFVEGDPFAGTEQHREISIKNLSRLLGR